jgi:hypothetical protein
VAGGDHGVSVFFRCVLLVVFVCCARSDSFVVKKFPKTFESTIVLLGFVVSHRWFDGFETNFHT